MSITPIKTPCIGRCSTVYGDLVCRGCKRFLHEVVGWNGYDDARKHETLLRLETLLVQVMRGKLQILDAARLRQQLEQRQIRYVVEQSPYCWAYQLIARGARMIKRLDAYGLALLPEYCDWSLVDVRDAIDNEFFALSEAHYQQIMAAKEL
jgi:predicted Fe-S protein YdhL (DUF1289 family)